MCCVGKCVYQSKRHYFIIFRNNIPFVDEELKREFGEVTSRSREYSRRIIEDRIEQRSTDWFEREEDMLDMIIACNQPDVVRTKY